MRDEIIESSWFEEIKKRVILLIILVIIALSVAYTFYAILWIEFFTLIIFLAGFISGKRDGIIVGAVSAGIYFLFNPLSFLSPIIGLYVFQVIYYVIVGLIGALTQNFLKSKDNFKPTENLYNLTTMAILGIVGAILIYIFEIITSVIYYTLYPFGDIGTYIIGGLSFTLIKDLFVIIEFLFLLPGLTMLFCKFLK